MPPIAIAGAIGAAGSIAGGALGMAGAGKQARAAERASEAAIAEQRRQFDITRADLAPWMGAGSDAVRRLAFLLGLGSPGGARGIVQPVFDDSGIARLNELRGIGGDGARFRFVGGEEGFDAGGIADRIERLRALRAQAGSPAGGAGEAGDFGSLMRDFGLGDFQADPGYDFRLSEGLKALERSAAARGGLFSGGTAKALTRYGQDVASQEFANAFNRFQLNRATRYNFLANLAGLGQATAGQLASLGQRSAENIGNIGIGGATAAAAARASGYGALGQAIGQGTNQALNWYLLSRLGRWPPSPYG